MMRDVAKKLLFGAALATASVNCAGARIPKIPDCPTTPEYRDQARKLQQSLANNLYRKDMQEKAAKLYKYTQSVEYQRRMKEVISRVFPEEAQRRKKARTPQQRLYLFISSSVPMHVLRRYAHQISRLPGATMVMRGFVNGATRIAPTVQFIRKLLSKEPNCHKTDCEKIPAAIIIDPYLFRRYSIERVPAVVVADGVQGNGTCTEGNTENVKVRDYAVSYGDAPIRTHLAAMAEEGHSVADVYLHMIEEQR